MKDMKQIFTPEGKIDVVIDTDLYNEIDDYYAIAYLFGHPERFSVKGVTIAPFFNHRVDSIHQSIQRSTQDLWELLELMGREDFRQVYPGGDTYLHDEETPVPSAAAEFIVECSKSYSRENRLYVIAIGAITSVASALLMDPTLSDRIAIVWLGGNADFIPENQEFNLFQDVAAARVVMKAEVPFLQVPCTGVVSAFCTGYYELEHFIKGKNPLCDRLFERTAVVAQEENELPTWTRVIWDVVAVAALNNPDEKYMRIIQKPRRLPSYGTGLYGEETDKQMLCVEWVHRDQLMFELFNTLQGF